MSKILKKLYSSKWGRLVLKILTAPALSKAAGCFLDSRSSIALIPLFIKSAGIDMTEVEPTDWQSFNEFFTRRLKEGMRPVDTDAASFISPCDADLSVYPIKDGSFFMVKGVRYSIGDLVKNKLVADTFKDGQCLIFRLSVNHYHRYVFPESGFKSRDIKIPGILHTVQPVATEAQNVYAQNSREYCVIKTDTAGPVVFMQVGAMLVGRISNDYPNPGRVHRGEEAGKFLYGGSTVIVLIKKDRVAIDEKIIKASKEHKEYPVRLGMKIGEIK